MALFLKRRWLLFVVLVVFVLFKLPHLYYPYYWDESWPYAPAIQAMYRHGISFLPTAVDGELSRGHPLFFHVMAASWMHIFGSSFLSMHSFALTISVICLMTVYEAGLKLFNVRVAMLSVLLIAIQAVFFLQSGFVLLEVLVGFLGFLSLFLYISEQYFLTTVCLTALFFTKESGFIMGFIVGIDAIVNWFNGNISWQKKMAKTAPVFISCVLIAVFFILQKQARGWYILPLYTDSIEHNWSAFWYRFRIGCIKYTFYDERRYLYYILLALVAGVAAIRQKKLLYLVILLPVIIIYYYVDDTRAGRVLPGIPFFILFICSIVFFTGSLIRLELFSSNRQVKLVVLSISFLFLYLCFSAMNYYINRYLLAAIIPGLFLTSVLFDKFFSRSYPVLFYPILIISLMIGISYLHFDTNYGDIKSSFAGMELQKRVTVFMEENNFYDNRITASFLQQQHLLDPATGFLSSKKAFRYVNYELNNNTEIAIFDNIEFNAPNYSRITKDTTFSLIYKYQKDPFWTEIYRKR